MPILVIIFVLVAIFSSLYKNKQREDEARRRRAQQVKAAESAPAKSPQQSTRGYDGTLRPTVGTRQMRATAATVAASAATATLKAAPSYSGSMQYSSSEGQGRGSLAGASGEGRGFGGSMPAQGGQTSHSMPHHTVKAATESAHGHMESSMTGIEPDCAPTLEDEVEFMHTDTSIDAYTMDAVRGELPFGLALDEGSVTRGLVMSEILNKPLALRRTR